MKHIKELADKVMKMLLFGENEVLHLLRKQYENSKIISTEETGVGFFIDYGVDKFKIDETKFNGNFQIGDVNGVANDTLVGFILFIKNGYLHFLEGFTYGIEKWPSKDLEIKLYYDDMKEERNLEKIIQILNK